MAIDAMYDLPNLDESDHSSTLPFHFGMSQTTIRSMRDLDLTTLRLFVAVCETQNMARAGEQEHIVASAISKRLAQLEETVGATLLERQRRGVTPTPAGEIVLTHARAMLAAADRVARDMEDYGSGI